MPQAGHGVGSLLLFHEAAGYSPRRCLSSGITEECLGSQAPSCPAGSAGRRSETGQSLPKGRHTGLSWPHAPEEAGLVPLDPHPRGSSDDSGSRVKALPELGWKQPLIIVLPGKLLSVITVVIKGGRSSRTHPGLGTTWCSRNKRRYWALVSEVSGKRTSAETPLRLRTPGAPAPSPRALRGALDPRPKAAQEGNPDA